MTGVPERPDVDRPHLANSAQMPWNRTARNARAAAAVEGFLGALEARESRTRARRAVDRERLRATLEAVLMALYEAAKADPERHLAYSRRKADYGQARSHPTASLTSVVQVVEFLVADGYASANLGSYRREASPFGGSDTGRGTLSRLRATPGLVVALEGRFGLTLDDIGFAAPANLVRLKAAPVTRRGAKRQVAFEETKAVAAMRNSIVAANLLRAEATITLDDTCGTPTVLEPIVSADVEDRANAKDASAVHLYRVFNNERWDHGGRFYGGWWQGISKHDRTRILIDGEVTVELDFTAYHPRLCYHLSGSPLAVDRDPYEIDGIDLGKYRGATKRAFSQLVNSAPHARLRRPQALSSQFLSSSDYAGFIARIERAFKPTKTWLRSGRGMELQFIDSEIIDAAINDLTAQGIVCLPIHDSLIVPLSAEMVAGAAMCRAYRNELVQRTGISAYPAIAGWSELHRDHRRPFGLSYAAMGMSSSMA